MSAWAGDGAVLLSRRMAQPYRSAGSFRASRCDPSMIQPANGSAAAFNGLVAYRLISPRFTPIRTRTAQRVDLGQRASPARVEPIIAAASGLNHRPCQCRRAQPRPARARLTQDSARVERRPHWGNHHGEYRLFRPRSFRRVPGENRPYSADRYGHPSL